MSNRRLILNCFIISIFITLCAFGSYVNADSGSVIIGLLHKQRLQEKALDNILTKQLNDADRKYNKQLLELDIQYLIDQEVLSKLNNDEKLKLVNDRGQNESYTTEKKDLEKLQQEQNAKLLKEHKLKRNDVEVLRKQEKKRFGHEHTPKRNKLRNSHKVEYNKLKEMHDANAKELYLQYKSEKNRLDEVITSEISALKATQKPEKDHLDSEYRQKLTKTISIDTKEYVKKVYQVERENIWNQHREARMVLARKQELRKQDLKSGKNIHTEALKRLHYIEKEGGIYSEYVHNKEILANINLILSYELDSEENTISSSNPPVSLFDKKSNDNATNSKLLNNALNGYHQPDGSLVFFPIQDDGPDWMKGQCVTGAKKLFNEVSDLKINQSIGPAEQIPTNSFISNNFHIESDHTKPVVGAMIVWKNTSKPIGHVGVITDVSSDALTVYDANSGKINADFEQWGLETYKQAQDEIVNTNYGKYTKKTFEYKRLDQLNIPGTNFVFSKYIYPK